MSKFLTLLFFALMCAAPALAKELGAEAPAAEIFCGAVELMTGNLGVAVGLLIAAAGLYTFLMSDQTSGALMILAGVALTALPSIYIGILGGYNGIFGERSEITAPPAACSNLY